METYGIKTNTGIALGEHGNFTDAKNIALKWLNSHIGEVSVSNRVTFAIDTFESPTITKDNIHLYYEFMSDEDLKENRGILNISFRSRNRVIEDLFCIDLLQVGFSFDTIGDLAIGQVIFGVKDTLKPIDEYLAEIKESDAYKEYVKQPTLFKNGDKIKCIKELKSFCNGKEKIIFSLNRIYDVSSFASGNVGIRIKDNGDGYTFFNNQSDKYFEKVQNIDIYLKNRICDNCIHADKSDSNDSDSCWCDVLLRHEKLSHGCNSFKEFS